MLIYLDVCCYNRPFDDQGQLVVRLQTEAKLSVQNAIREGVFQLAWSAVIDLENDANPDMAHREAIAKWRHFASDDLALTDRIEALANEYAELGAKPMDALHVASAVESGASYFLTTDKALLRKMVAERRIRVVDPLDFIRLIEGTTDEN